MKTKLLLFLIPALFSVAIAQPVPRPERPVVVAKRSMNPIFPRGLLELGVVEGECRVVISIDETGKVVDHLVIAATHPMLAEATENVLKYWEFEPPTLRGQPVSVQRELQFIFDNRGTVVSIDVNSYVMSIPLRQFPDKYAFKPATMQELDRIPTPLEAAAPFYSKELAAQGHKGAVVVEFYIDPTGTVKMPSIVEAATPELGALSVEAVRGWKFEPPTCRGKPVLLRVQQTFRFNP
jgi:TonB family protein